MKHAMPASTLGTFPLRLEEEELASFHRWVAFCHCAWSHTHTHTYTHTHTHTHTETRGGETRIIAQVCGDAHARARTHTHTQLHTQLYTANPECLRVYIALTLDMCLCACVCVCMCVCVSHPVRPRGKWHASDLALSLPPPEEPPSVLALENGAGGGGGEGASDAAAPQQAQQPAPPPAELEVWFHSLAGKRWGGNLGAWARQASLQQIFQGKDDGHMLYAGMARCVCLCVCDIVTHSRSSKVRTTGTWCTQGMHASLRTCTIVRVRACLCVCVCLNPERPCSLTNVLPVFHMHACMCLPVCVCATIYVCACTDERIKNVIINKKFPELTTEPHEVWSTADTTHPLDMTHTLPGVERALATNLVVVFPHIKVSDTQR